jgi:hypothetical protein
MCFYLFLNNKEKKPYFLSKNSVNSPEIFCNICNSKKYLVKIKCNHTICIKCISKINYYDSDKCILCTK